MRSSVVHRRLRVVMVRSLVGVDCDPSSRPVAAGRSIVVTHCVPVSRSSLVACCHLSFARRRRLCFFIACCRWMAFVRRYSSCGDAIVVSSATSSFVRSLATIVVLRCFSSLDNDRSLSLVGRLSLVRRRSCVVIVRTFVGGDCDP